MYKGYKVRLYPTKEQEELLWKHIDAQRFMWNYMLAWHEDVYNKTQDMLHKFDMIRKVSELKHSLNYEWLNNVSVYTLRQACIDLDMAYTRYFKCISQHPNFKTKKSRHKSFATRPDRLHFGPGFVKLDTIKKVRIKPIEHSFGKIVNPRVSFINNKWILSFEYEGEKQAHTKTEKSMGIDLGVKNLAVVSYGDDELVFHNINKSKRVRNIEHKLKHIERVIQRKYRTNKSYEKTNGIVKYEKIKRCLYYKLFNIRQNYIHQTTNSLVKLNPDKVVMEKLNVVGMMHNKFLAKSVQGQQFAEFIRQMEYKCDWNGIEFIQADRFFPSSKMCSNCGKVKRNLTLDDRTYKCECGLEIDRDYNAAINLMRYVPPTKRCTA
jgi:putative transposase